jgi:hypothetical protein
LNSDFQYEKIQLYYKQPIVIGPLGRSNVIMEVGKTFGYIPLGLMSVIPGNQTYFTIENTFSNWNFMSLYPINMRLCNGNIIWRSLVWRIPFMRKLNWGDDWVRSVYGTISDANRAINASGLNYVAPERAYWEYSAGVGNIFKLLRLDFTWRGNYLNNPMHKISL